MRSQIQFDELLDRLSHQNFTKESFVTSLEKLFSGICQDLKASRVGFWMYLKKEQSLENFLSWEESASKSKALPKISSNNFENFSVELLTKPFGTINALHINAFSEEFDTSFFKKDGTEALAWVQVSLHGNLIGLIMVEGNHHRVWKQLETLYLLTCASHLSSAYSSHLLKKKKASLESTTLFEENPLPVFICDLQSKKILGTNPRGERLYGYSSVELKNLSFWDMGELQEVEISSTKTSTGQFFKGFHKTQKGKMFPVRVITFPTVHFGKKVWACLVIDSLEEVKLTGKNQELIDRLNDYAFYTSHNIRGPLANILGLIDLIPYVWEEKKSYEEIIFRLKTQSLVLEETIRVMAAKVELD